MEYILEYKKSNDGAILTSSEAGILLRLWLHDHNGRYFAEGNHLYTTAKPEEVNQDISNLLNPKYVKLKVIE